ncbi:MAG: glutamate 5-kinase [Planctomycetota bacterium]
MPSTQLRQRIVESVSSMVVKVGTNAICDAQGQLETRVVGALASQIARAMQDGVSVALVASGAVGAGMAELGLDKRPKTLPMLQATAAVGQGQLMRRFHDIFARRKVKVAQVLVTRDDFEDRKRYINIRNTLTTLWECGVLPIINENDAAGVEEFRFGDNDIIAALVNNMLAADLLVLLTTVDGVLKDGKVLELIQRVDDEAFALVNASRSCLGSGGMASKIAAAGMVVTMGEMAAIANARTGGILDKLRAGRKVGTVFVPADRKISSRRKWIAQATRPAGTLVIDSGAARALQQRGKSLLPSGIAQVQGSFDTGDVVRIATAEGVELARGLTNYPADQLRQIMGKQSSQIEKILGEKPYDEAVHRNNLSLTDRAG